MRWGRTTLIWAVLVVAIAVPIGAAATSPLLAWRDPVYIAAGFAGIVAMSLLLVQPLLIGGYLPGLRAWHARQIHRLVGVGLVAAVALHVAGLWITSPPDAIDALLFTSPTPFSDWGVIAMWAVVAAAVLAAFRRRFRLRPRAWRLGHTVLAAVTVGCSAIHALLVEGTMEPVSKAALCALVVLATVMAVAGQRVWAGRR